MCRIVSAGIDRGEQCHLPLGFSLLFLASAYGDEDNADRRKKLEDILTRAARFFYPGAA